MPARAAAPAPVPSRNADRSRIRILEAATRHFAEQGFAATSLAQIGADAGLSRGAPAYFFGSKAELYDAVLADAETRLGTISERLRDHQLGPDGSPAMRVARLVEALDAALAADTVAVRLVVAAGSAATGRSLAQLTEALAEAFARSSPAVADASAWQLLAESAVLLCWLPHALPLAPPQALSAEARRAHTVRLIVRGAAALVTLGGAAPVSDLVAR